MARPHRLQIQDGIYVISLEGTEGIGLFVENSDCEHFLGLIDIIARKHHITLHAYALAGNRTELMFHAPRGNPSAFIQALQTGYARHLHHHYVHQGPVTKGRYKSKLVEPNATLATVAAWIHTLPVREAPSLSGAQRIKDRLMKDRYTSLNAFLGGTSAPPACLDPQPVLKALGGRVNTRAERFRSLCETLAVEPDAQTLNLLRASPIAIGSPEFLSDIRTLHEAVRKGKGGKTLRLHGKAKRGIPAAKLIEAVAAEFSLNPKKLHQRPRNDLGRPALAYVLYNHGERTQGDIAKQLGLTSAAAVSLQIRRLLTARSESPDLDKRLARVERALDKLS
jgi:putative transposase